MSSSSLNIIRVRWFSFVKIYLDWAASFHLGQNQTDLQDQKIHIIWTYKFCTIFLIAAWDTSPWWYRVFTCITWKLSYLNFICSFSLKCGIQNLSIWGLSVHKVRFDRTLSAFEKWISSSSTNWLKFIFFSLKSGIFRDHKVLATFSILWSRRIKCRSNLLLVSGSFCM